MIGFAHFGNWIGMAVRADWVFRGMRGNRTLAPARLPGHFNARLIASPPGFSAIQPHFQIPLGTFEFARSPLKIVGALTELFELIERGFKFFVAPNCADKTNLFRDPVSRPTLE